MKTAQKRAIYYTERKRKLNKIEAMGLMPEYLEYKGNSDYHKIERFARKKGITL